jgi:hypothetical protein
LLFNDDFTSLHFFDEELIVDGQFFY